MKKLIISLFLCAGLVSVMAQTKTAPISTEKTKVETKKDVKKEAPKKVVEKKITKDGQKPETKQVKK